MYSYDNLRKWIGKQATKNWIGTALSDFKVPLTKNSIRLLFKKTYYN